MKGKQLARFILARLMMVVSLLAVIVLLAGARPATIGTTDFVQYWTAVQLFLSGQGVYNQVAIQAVQRPLNLPEFPIYMWNPPFILPLFLWCYYFDFITAASLWFAGSVILVVLALGVLKRLFALRSLTSATVLIFLITFYPIALMIYYGQISSVLLLSFAGFLLVARKRSFVGSWWGGVIFGVGLVKPHLLWLVYLQLLLCSIRARQCRTLVGMLSFVALALALVVSISPNVVDSYLASWQVAPTYWKTPTVGSWLQEFGGGHRTYLRFLPTIAALMIAIPVLVRTWHIPLGVESIVMLVPFSLLLSPYGWVYDQILLLPGALWVLGYGRIWAKLLLILANIIMLSCAGGTGQELMVWYPLLHVFALVDTRQIIKSNQV